MHSLGGIMRALKILLVALALGALPLSAFPQQPSKLTEVVDRIVAQEQAEMQSLHQYSPIVETYIQVLRANKDQGAVPKGDKYFLGRAELAKGVEIEPLITDGHSKHNMFGGIGRFVSMEFLPRGFLQMVYLDTTGFNRQHYKFNYVGREFLGQVRCLVFDVDPVSKDDKGRFVGRIWVEDQDYHIVRFNGGYSSRSKTSYYFNFDSWRTNAGKDKWLPSFIYSEEANSPMVQSFRAQTRLWSYAPTQDREEQELSKVVVEAAKPVTDQTEVGYDYSPLEEKRAWGRQAEDNIATKMEQMGLMAQYGDVDKVLETVVNNIEVTNNLDIEPTVHCRVLMTSTMESFTMGHTIVLSRGLVDVLPDEASLAAILAHELGHIVLRHRMGTQYAFFNRLRFEEKETFRHFGFTHTAEEEQAASQEGMELLKKSPYKDHIGSAQLFLQALNDRSKEIPNLVSPHLGNRVVIGVTSTSATPSEGAASKATGNLIAALPLGGRIKIEPWDNRLQMLKTKPVGTVAKDELMPFELTPFFLYLTRQGDTASAEVPGAVAVKSAADADLTDAKP
jgi:hypothetical protein